MDGDAFDATTLRPSILQILSAPGTDLELITAKRVRLQLVEKCGVELCALFGFGANISVRSFPDLDVKTHKKEIDEEILDCFKEVYIHPPMLLSDRPHQRMTS
jgi:hypothetical protein